MILYKMIVDAGLLLQLDDVRNATAVGTSKTFGAGCRDIVKHAIEDLPADRVRYHVSGGAHGWQAWKIVKLARAHADPGRHQP